MIAELRGGVCIFGRSSFKSRERLDAAAGFSVRHFFLSLQGVLSLQSSKCGIFSKGCRCRAQGAAFFLKGVIFSELHSLQLFFRYHTQKNNDGGAQVGNAYLAYMVVTPLVYFHLIIVQSFTTRQLPV